MRREVVIAGLGLMACACAGGPRPEPVVRLAQVPVATACAPTDLPPPPVFADSREALLAAAGANERYRLLAAEWLRRKARLELLEAVVEACR